MAALTASLAIRSLFAKIAFVPATNSLIKPIFSLKTEQYCSSALRLFAYPRELAETLNGVKRLGLATGRRDKVADRRTLTILRLSSVDRLRLPTVNPPSFARECLSRGHPQRGPIDRPSRSSCLERAHARMATQRAFCRSDGAHRSRLRRPAATSNSKNPKRGAVSGGICGQVLRPRRRFRFRFMSPCRPCNTGAIHRGHSLGLSPKVRCLSEAWSEGTPVFSARNRGHHRPPAPLH